MIYLHNCIEINNEATVPGVINLPQKWREKLIHNHKNLVQSQQNFMKISRFVHLCQWCTFPMNSHSRLNSLVSNWSQKCGCKILLHSHKIMVIQQANSLGLTFRWVWWNWFQIQFRLNFLILRGILKLELCTTEIYSMSSKQMLICLPPLPHIVT